MYDHNLGSFISLFAYMFPLIRFLSIALVSSIAFYFYYIFYPWHGEDKTYVFYFVILNLVVYICYKAVSFLFPKTKSEIHLLHIIGFFLVELFLLCLCFFGFQQANAGLGIFLFFKISGILAIISLLWIIIYSFGRTILKKLHIFSHDEHILLGLSALGLGFSLFGLGIFVLGYFGLYTFPAVAIFIVILGVVSYKQIQKTIEHSTNPIIVYEQSVDVRASFGEKINFSRVIDELNLWVVTFLLGVNFINVYRPFPIGWDDLGVYMNFPRLMAQSGELGALGKMHFWELYTGLGFLTGSQVFAFFLNSFSGVIAAGVIYFALKVLIGEKKTIFHLPLFGVMILLMLPMTVFQLAKDMKLDYGFLSMSIIPLVLVYYFVIGQVQKSRSQTMMFFGMIGFFIGIAFSIKLTALLLLLGILGVLFYRYYALLGFLSFFTLFIGIFTLGGFWSMMNVLIPEVSSFQKILFSGFCIVSGLILSAGSIFLQKHKIQHINQLVADIVFLFLGFIIAIIPWGIKHLGELEDIKDVSISTLLNGVADQYIPDYTKIYTPEELLKKEEELRDLVSNQGKVSNEDFGRYLGYESGINNYLKLPWNLSFQVNQKGEFTDITFVFFALIPLIFLFLPYKRAYYMYPILIGEALLLLYYIPSSFSVFLIQVFSKIELPLGYGIIFLFFLLPFLYLYFTLDRKEKVSQIFLVNLAFSTIYVFLWSISSFGIVWYGITMYFVFLVMITVSLLAAHESDKRNGYMGVYLILFVVWMYVSASVIPHGVTNLRTAGYSEYKLGKETQEVSLMNLHPDYFPVLLALNIAEDKKQELFIEYKKKLLTSVGDLPDVQNLTSAIDSLQNLSQLERLLTELSQYTISLEVNTNIKQIRQDLYEEVMNTPKDLRSRENIYRVGTFLKYFISENNSRVFEDSLLTSFGSYFDDMSDSVIRDRFKKMQISYLLLDLNAATIDQDPEQNLTKRYENMLRFLPSTHLELIESDSICLKLGIDIYRQTQDTDLFLKIAGVNHGTSAVKQEKFYTCVDTIAELLVEKKVSLESYPYLLLYQNALPQLKINPDDRDAIRNGIAQYISPGFKALFKIK